MLQFAMVKAALIKLLAMLKTAKLLISPVLNMTNNCSVTSGSTSKISSPIRDLVNDITAPIKSSSPWSSPRHIATPYMIGLSCSNAQAAAKSFFVKDFLAFAANVNSTLSTVGTIKIANDILKYVIMSSVVLSPPPVVLQHDKVSVLIVVKSAVPRRTT